MNYERINWDNGTKIKEGYTIINGQEYPTVQPEYTGNTPVNPENLNHMDEQIEALSVDYIVERGGDWNTNYYEKWASGKLVQWGQSVFTDAMTTANASFYRPASEITKSFVKPFIDTNYSMQLTGLGGYISVAYISARYTDRFCYFPLATWSVNNTNNKYVHWLAIGKWKQ